MVHTGVGTLEKPETSATRSSRSIQPYGEHTECVSRLMHTSFPIPMNQHHFLRRLTSALSSYRHAHNHPHSILRRHLLSYPLYRHLALRDGDVKRPIRPDDDPRSTS